MIQHKRLVTCLSLLFNVSALYFSKVDLAVTNAVVQLFLLFLDSCYIHTQCVPYRKSVSIWVYIYMYSISLLFAAWQTAYNSPFGANDDVHNS